MKTKIAYALVSDRDDVYALQAWVSVVSLRRHNPDAVVVLACDRPTADSVRTLPLAGLIDETVVIDLPEGMTARERSRRVKTGLRDAIEGDFFYIDVDTIITGPLDSIDEVDCELAAVADAHCSLEDNPYMEMNRKNAAVLGYGFDGETQFFNGGAVLARDTETAREFYRTWNRFYDEGTRKGIFIDQTSYARANIFLGHPMEELPGVWNCQLRHGTRFLSDARVVHYLWTAKNARNPFLLGRPEIWDKMRRTMSIPPEVTELFDDPFKGLQDMTYLASKEETAFFNTRVYKVSTKFARESGGFNKALKLCVRTLDFIYKKTHKQ